MSRISDLVTKASRELASSLPLSPNRQTASDGRLIKLDSNENPFGPSPQAITAMREALTSAHAYPDDHCDELCCKLAARHDVKPEQVLVTPGSTGMLSLLCQTFLGPGLNAVTSALSFIVYGMVVHAAGGRLIETPVCDNGFDLDAILGAIDADTRLVFLANPNNPTGTLLEVPAIDEFLKRVPEHVVVVLDEAYYEFAELFASQREMEYSRSLEYVRQDARVVVLRTFSKVHGLAGLRVGYGLGPAELLGYCARMANTYALSSIAQTAALAALDDQSHVERTVSNNTIQAKVLMDALIDMGYRPVPTFANFLYFDTGADASAVAARLRSDGISVRPLAAWGAPSCIRVSVGTSDQNQKFLAALRRAKNEL